VTVAQEDAIIRKSITTKRKISSMHGGFRMPVNLDSGLRRNDGTRFTCPLANFMAVGFARGAAKCSPC